MLHAYDEVYGPPKNRGHEWRRDKDGSIDIWGLEYEHHNGPVCVRCGYSFCHHCQTGPTEDCKGD